MHRLFSYGTLRLPSVQQAVFGGPVPGTADAIIGHRLAEVRITDPSVIELSGQEIHPILVPAEPDAEVPGVVFDLDDEQLAAADDFEIDAYRREEHRLRSGGTAWVYVLDGQVHPAP